MYYSAHYGNQLAHNKKWAIRFSTSKIYKTKSTYDKKKWYELDFTNIKSDFQEWHLA